MADTPDRFISPANPGLSAAASGTSMWLGFREQLGFHHARPIGQRKKFHRLAGGLMMGALLNHQAARHHGLADVLAQSGLLKLVQCLECSNDPR
jgi:hypothetical protein